MKHYGMDSQGFLKIEEVATLPAHAGSEDLRKILFVTSENKIYFGTLTEWLPFMTGSYTISTSDPSGGSDGDLWFKVSS